MSLSPVDTNTLLQLAGYQSLKDLQSDASDEIKKLIEKIRNPDDATSSQVAPTANKLPEQLSTDPPPPASVLTNIESGMQQLQQDMRQRLQSISDRQIVLLEGQNRETLHTPSFPLFVDIPSLPDDHPVIGREALVTDVVEMLLSDDHRPVVLEGMGGIGKTMLAAMIARDARVREHFKDGVLWAGLGPQGNGMQQLMKWGDALGNDLTDFNEEKRLASFQQHIETNELSLLLVIDDVWDMEAVKPLQCAALHCCRLFTTRNQQIAIELAGQDRTITVSELDEASAWELLEAMASDACQVDSEAAQHLLQRVDGLPLAIELLGGYLREPERRLFPNMSAEALAELMDPQQRLELVTKRLGALDDKKTTLAAIIALSLEDLPENAREAFYSLGAFAPKPEVFDREAVLAVTAMDSDTLSHLLVHNLVGHAGEDQYILHPLVADVALTKPSTEATERHWEYYLSIVNADRENWRVIEPVYGQITWAWQAAPDNRQLIDFQEMLHIYQDRQGLWHELTDWLQRVLDMAHSQGWQSEEGIILNNLATVYYAQGRWDDARQMFEGSLHIGIEQDNRHGQAGTLNNLGMVYYKQERWDDARQMFVDSLRMYRASCDIHGEGQTLNNLGMVYLVQKRWDDALLIFEDSLRICRELDDTHGEGQTLNNLGVIYLAQKQWDDALRIFGECLSIQRTMGDRQSESISLANLGRIYQNQGRWDDALQMFEDSLRISQELGDIHGEGVTLVNLGIVYFRQADLRNMLVFYQEALTKLYPDSSKYNQVNMFVQLLENRVGILFLYIIAWLTCAIYWLKLRMLLGQSLRAQVGITRNQRTHERTK